MAQRARKARCPGLLDWKWAKMANCQAPLLPAQGPVLPFPAPHMLFTVLEFPHPPTAQAVMKQPPLLPVLKLLGQLWPLHPGSTYQRTYSQPPALQSGLHQPAQPPARLGAPQQQQQLARPAQQPSL